MQTQKSSRLLGVAVVMFGIGMVASLALLFPAVRDTGTVPVTIIYILAMGAPVGLFLGVVFALLSGRRSR
ncbi:hypothetical protein [Gordonia sp. (in: high G+C Gram-positive bacteria)]|uniref:hypothetical protein n=1 Tax=Gordonia sp. (in: high G+C Gram-positive bacteria) TaxID=84139 RepID=UPI0016942B64|nr:hypothetical protein [Gordonia sp. (in: high G+C Gram-positive bacteria)]NLG46861.1 hypothetical protein [Gordonia sp. (in: high G+C Gram-positive bacteria)]